MQIFMKLLYNNGSTKTLTVEPNETIIELKHKIREKTGIGLSRMKIVLPSRKYLTLYSPNSLTISDVGLRNESTIQVYPTFKGCYYCIGCMLPQLIHLSANISLECNSQSYSEYFSEANKPQFLRDVGKQLACLGNDIKRIVLDCIKRCGREWNEIEIEDANYSKFNIEEMKRKEAIELFVYAMERMIFPYLKSHRTSTKNEPISIDWFKFLHETRCPICLCRFTINNTQPNSPNRCPMAVCSVSDKHLICSDCSPELKLCPLCNGKLVGEIKKSQEMIDQIKEALSKLNEYCFPDDLKKEITIEKGQQPMANGSMGKIYRVNNKYAVKFAIASNTPQIEEAFTHEIAISRPLAHIPNLVAVLGGVRLPELGIGVVMEYVDGPSLAAALSENSSVIRDLDMKERLKIALGICQGLGELHLAKVVHRDFKPENVLLVKTENGLSYTPKIVDFGISFQLSTASATCVRDSCGTVGYDAPEVVVDNSLPTEKSDIYALAFTLYELLTGKRLFVKLKPAQIIAQYTMRGERPRDWPSSVPADLRRAIEQSWSVKPEQRASIGSLVNACRKALDPNHRSCKEMLEDASKQRKVRINEVKIEEFTSFELFVLNEFLKRISIEDCEAIKMIEWDYRSNLLNSFWVEKSET